MRPSELCHITDQLEAFWFDRAVTTFGTALENDLEQASSKARNARKAELARQRVIEQWLGIPMKFRDPAAVKKESSEVSSQQSGPVVL